MKISETVLAHYGVKGMKWGRRRSSSTSTAPTNTKYKKPPARLSDQELNRRIKRLELEKKYTELNSGNSKTQGKKYAESIVSNSGKQVAGAIVGGVATFAVQRALKSAFGNN